MLLVGDALLKSVRFVCRHRRNGITCVCEFAAAKESKRHMCDIKVWIARELACAVGRHCLIKHLYSVCFVVRPACVSREQILKLMILPAIPVQLSLGKNVDVNCYYL